MFKHLTTLIIILLCFSISNSFGQCITGGYNNPSNHTLDTSVGVAGWSNTGDISSSDDNYASVTAVSLGDASYYLVANDFGLSIPASASVCGITVEIEKSASGLFQNVHDSYIRLMKGGSVTGSNKASPGTWPSTDTYFSYGGVADLWGDTWTPSEINASDFGIAVSVNLSGVSVLPSAQVDHIRIRVHYVEVLPIKLISFDGKWLDDQAVELNWTTASETGNDFFTVEYSTTGYGWEAIQQINAVGDSKALHNYSVIHNNETSKSSFYRLKQTDSDGQYSYSAVITVAPSKTSMSVIIKTYPNPAKEAITVKLSSGIVRLAIYDQSGKMIRTHSSSIPNNSSMDIPIGQLKNGFYIIHLMDSNGEYYTRKIIKE